MAAPVEATDRYARIVDVWRRRIHGVDLSAMAVLAAHRPTAARFEPSHLLSAPQTLGTIDLMHTTSCHAGGATTFEIVRDGTLHGVCGCFVTTLADDISMGNVPGDSGTTNFAQAFFPVASPVAVIAGDHVAIHLETHDSLAARWQVEVTRLGQSIARFDHSTLQAEALSMQALRKQSSDYRPSLTALGAVEHDLLDRFDGTHSAGELASWLTDRWASVLPSSREAAVFLKAAIERYG
jgi:hypothetical protein